MTLLEILVVVGILAILVMVVLPAVQASREAARSLQCVSNLRQLGIAMQSYSGVHGMFTPSQLKTGSNWSSNRFSEMLYLLPYIEKIELYNSINMSYSSLEGPSRPSLENRTARNTVVSMFLCPSDWQANIRNSYRFNRGRLGGGGRSGFDGPFNIRVLPTESIVRDGLSNTAFVSERIAGTFSSDLNRIQNIKYAGETQEIFSSDQVFIPYCLASSASSWNSTAGKFWFYSDFSNTHYNHNGTPNDKRVTCGAEIADDDGFGLNPPRSYHPGKVHVLFGDTHIQSVTDHISENIWIALGTYDQGD